MPGCIRQRLGCDDTVITLLVTPFYTHLFTPVVDVVQIRFSPPTVFPSLPLFLTLWMTITSHILAVACWSDELSFVCWFSAVLSWVVLF